MGLVSKRVHLSHQPGHVFTLGAEVNGKFRVSVVRLNPCRSADDLHIDAA